MAEDYERWKDFALRMARTCWDERRRPSRSWIVKHVEDFIYCLDVPPEDFYLLRSWDESDPYPVGHRYYRATQRGQYTDYAHPMYMCDQMSTWETDRLWYSADELATKEEFRRLKYWFDRDIDKYDEIREKIVERYSSPVHCCLRAALDMVHESSAGILGFTVCDLQRMYGGKVPEWINKGWRTHDGKPVDLNEGSCEVRIWL